MLAATLTLEMALWMIAAGFGTSIGGLALLFARRPSERTLAGMLGFTAGVMLAATSFSLLVPALDLGSIAEVVAGLVAGAALLAFFDAILPHAHARLRERGHERERLQLEQRAILLLSALTLHNVPEGLAVGIAFAAGGPELGVPIALAIGIQNIPEGFAAAAPLVALGRRRRVAAGVAALTGAVEPPAAFAAFTAFVLAEALLPFGLSFAAGAMLYVVVDELIPEANAGGNERVATIALVGGFALMLVLDNAFA
ncbi:MAG: ZIP family metal transporter [Actinobacteria bacterium]|nr:ZIP family metal transporter [Actinomycetota bacterium]